jgi:hypothetical protein
MILFCMTVYCESVMTICKRDNFGAIFHRLPFSVKPVFLWRFFRIFFAAICRLCGAISGVAANSPNLIFVMLH